MTVSKSGRIVSVNISDRKGEKKRNVSEVRIITGHGIEGDAHAGCDPIREISILSMESIGKIREKGLDVRQGDFGENITVEGLEVYTLPIGTLLKVGEVLLEVTKIGKECKDRCAIFQQVGDCVMPREGIFVKSLTSGILKPGDEIVVEG